MIQTVLNLPPAKYATPEQTYGFYTRLQDRLAALPGAKGATVSWTLPVFQYLTSRSLVVEGQPAPAAGHEPVSYINAVMPSYLPTLGIKLQAGRNFTDADKLGAVPVAIINASLAQALFPGGDAIGHRLGNPDPKNPGWLEIVGVVPDVGLAVGVVPSTTKFLVLKPLAQEPWNYVTVSIRADQPGLLADPMRQAIAALDPDLVLQQFGTMPQVTQLATGGFAMLTKVLVCFAGLGLFLASIGLYGVIARVVVQRTAEIGVRIALGAQARDVVWMIVRSGLRLTLIGAVLGLIGAVGLSWIISRAIPNPPPGEPMIFVVVTGIMITVGVVACVLPARRAAKVDPMVALRAE